MVYSDLYSAYDKNVSGVQHEKKSSRRLLIDVFQQGLRPIKHEIRTYMISTEDMDEAHFLVHPKERNCRYWNAREYGWTNHQRRITNTVLESNIRDTKMRFNKDVTAGVSHHHMLADLMVFAEPSLDGMLPEDSNIGWCELSLASTTPSGVSTSRH